RPGVPLCARTSCFGDRDGCPNHSVGGRLEGAAASDSPPRAKEAGMRDPVAEFKAYNRPFARRSPELLRYKVARMAAGPFPFYRGTFHLFARDVLGGLAGPLPVLSGPGPEPDLVGDVHGGHYG